MPGIARRKLSGNQDQHWHTLVHSKAMVSQEQGEVTVVLSDLCVPPSSPLLSRSSMFRTAGTKHSEGGGSVPSITAPTHQVEKRPKP